MASSNDGRKLKVTLVKSGIGYSRRQKRTIGLSALRAGSSQDHGRQSGYPWDDLKG